MELKVWVEGIQRIVCGVTVTTTCQDVVFALAHATGKIGRFTLIERWRNNERLLAPNENPLKLLLKWGEYANDVQFILQRCENKQQSSHSILPSEKEIQENFRSSQTVMTKKPLGLSNTNNKNLSNKINNNQTFNNHVATIVSSNNNQNSETNTMAHKTEIQRNDINLIAATERTKELRKSFGVNEKQSENIGIVKGVPQTQNNNKFYSINNNVTNSIAKYSPSDNNVIVKSIPSIFQANSISPNKLVPRHGKSHSNPTEMPSANVNNGSHCAELNKNISNEKISINGLYTKIGGYNSKSTTDLNLGEAMEPVDSKSLLTNIGSTSSNSVSSLNNRNSAQLLGSLSLKENSSSAENYINNHSASEINNTNNYNDSNSENDSSLGIDYLSNGHKSIINNETNVARETDSIENNLVNIFNISMKNDTSDIIPIISSNGALVPPPYRNPPPPRRSPMQPLQNEPIGNHSPTTTVKAISASISSSSCDENQVAVKTLINDINGNCKDDDQIFQEKSLMPKNEVEDSDRIFQATQYNDLIQLIKYQREKISTQQMDLNKVDSEIIYLENKEHEQAEELEFICKDISKVDKMFRLGAEQLQALQYVEKENELVKQQEKTLKSEIMLLRSKLVNCETELLQCRNKIRLLMDDIEIEKRAMCQKQKQNRQHVERDFVIEMERIRSEIDAALTHTEMSSKTTENLKREIFLIEQAIAEKKCQVEKLVNEMKEANLQSLQVVTSEEIKNLLEGPQKQGSSRRIIGSPRQLENAVATNKNPHGVWV